MNDTSESQRMAMPIFRLSAEHLRLIKFPQLTRPAVGPGASATVELINWAILAYCFPWIRHISALIAGMVLLTDSDNKAAVRIVGRSSFEFCAHAHYVKKHVKQHLDAHDLDATWSFLLPIGTGSRYINEYHHPEESELFPAPPHISKAVNCFKEVMPKGTEDDYSYLSEYCHPNTMTFQQHYRWTSPYTIEFDNQVEIGAFGAIAASLLNGLIAIHELLTLSNEQGVSSAIVKLLALIAQQASEQ